MKPYQFIFKTPRKTQAYQKTIKIDIDKINTFEKINKINTNKWRPIYKVIEEAYFKESEKFPDDFMKQCKDNKNESQFVTLDVRIT